MLVRFIAQDGPSQLAAATRLISRCVFEGSTLFVPVAVVLDLEWVLRSSFANGADDVPKTLARIFSAAEWTFGKGAAPISGAQLLAKA